MMCKALVVLVVTYISSEIVSAATDKVICYHGSWSTYREGNSRFAVEDIDPTLCTHLIYAFAGLSDGGYVKILDGSLELDNENFERFNALKTKNPKLKTLLGIGGWNESSLMYSKVAADSRQRKNLIESALNVVRYFGFDGVDLDWEYPGQRGGSRADRRNFVTLVTEFRKEWDKHGFLLTAAVSADTGWLDFSYNVPQLSKHLDFISIMTQNSQSANNGVTYAQKLFDLNNAVWQWILRGASLKKLALGLDIYGTSYTLADSSHHGIGDTVINSKDHATLGYNEICELQREGGWTTVWNDKQRSPYAYKGNRWVSFDDPDSIILKVQLAKFLNIAGVMVWAVEEEDFRGVSGTEYPILRAINSALGLTPNTIFGAFMALSEVSRSSFSARSTSTALCSKAGYIRDPEDCSAFYYCLPHNGGFVPLRQVCNYGLVFDEDNNICDYPENVVC